MPEYTPGHVWQILTGGAETIEEKADVEVGLKRLPDSTRLFLTLLVQGQTARYAMHEAGLRGNQTRAKRAAIIDLTNLINGREDD